MFPILVIVYVRLAKREERIALEEFGEQYRSYMNVTPAFIPKLSSTVAEGKHYTGDRF